MTKRLTVYSFIRFYKEDLWGRLRKVKYKKKLKINKIFLQRKIKKQERKTKIKEEKKRLKQLYLKPNKKFKLVSNNNKIKFSEYLSQRLQRATNYRLYKLNLARFLHDLKETQVTFSFRIDIGKPKPKKRIISVFGRRLLNKHLLRHFYAKTLSNKQFRIASKKMRSYISSFFFFGNFFELRIDALLYRLNFVLQPGHARQLINHKHVLVNGKLQTFSNYCLTLYDVFSVQNKIFFYLNLLSYIKKKSLNSSKSPYFLEINYRIMTAMVYKTPLFFKLKYPLKFKPSLISVTKGRF
jgi:ribosomal protein S4